MCVCVGGLVGTQSGAERAGGWESSRVCVFSVSMLIGLTDVFMHFNQCVFFFFLCVSLDLTSAPAGRRRPHPHNRNAGNSICLSLLVKRNKMCL